MSPRSTPRRACRRTVRLAVETLELRTHLSGNPTMTWDLAEPSSAPSVRINLDGANWAVGGPAKFRGLNLTSPDVLNELSSSAGADASGNYLRGAPNGAMPHDGNYEFHLPATAVTPNLSDELVQTGFFVDGDVNHDRSVDFDDLLVIAANTNSTTLDPDGATFAQGDLNADGLVDFNDTILLASKYNTRLAEAPSYAGEVTVSSQALINDASETDGTRTSLTVTFAPIADSTDDPTTPAVEPTFTIAGYSVFRSTDGYSFSKIGSVARDVTPQYEDDTAVDGMKYWYRIRPYYNVTLPDGSAGIEHLETTNKDSGVAAIGGALNVIAHGNTSTSLTLTWDDGAQHETGYRVYAIAKDGVTRTLRATVGANATSATVTGLDANVAYTFAVVAYTAGIESMPAIVHAATGVSASYLNSSDGIRVSWNAPSGVTASSFSIYRQDTPGGDFNYIGYKDASAADSTTYFDANVTRGQTYTYKVVATSIDPTTWTSTDVELGQTAVAYALRPVISYTSDTLTITWPTGQTPPATLDVTIHNKDTGETTTTTVPVAPIGDTGTGDGSGDYVVPGLTPDTNLDVSYDDPSDTDSGDPDNGDPSNGDPSTSDQPTPVTMRTFVAEESAYLENGTIASYPYAGVASGVTEHSTWDTNGGVAHDGDTITYTLTNLPEHQYIKVGGTLEVQGGDTSQADGSLEGTAGSADLTSNVQHLSYAPYVIGLDAEGPDKWFKDSSSSLTITYTIHGLTGGGLYAVMGGFKVDIGTPTVGVKEQAYAEEKAGPATAVLQRTNDVARDKPVTANVSLASGPNAATASDLTLDSSTVTISGGEDTGELEMTAVDDEEEEGLQDILLTMQVGTSQPTTQQAGTRNDEIQINSYTVTAVPDFSKNSTAIYNSYNGYEFLAAIVLKGERLNELESHNSINSSTVYWDWDTGQQANVPGDTVMTNSSGWKTDTGGDWAGVPANGKVGDHQSYIDTAIESGFDRNMHLVNGAHLMWVTRYFKIEFRNAVSHAAYAKTIEWGFKWTNYNIVWDPVDQPPHNHMSEDKKGPGQFSGQQLITGI